MKIGKIYNSGNGIVRQYKNNLKKAIFSTGVTTVSYAGIIYSIVNHKPVGTPLSGLFFIGGISSLGKIMNNIGDLKLPYKEIKTRAKQIYRKK